MTSPIKYYGGKTYMTDIIKKYFPQDSYDIYVEGFGGGASVLLSMPPKGIEVYNDLNNNVYSLWKVISDSELFQQLKNRLDLSIYHSSIRQEYIEKLKDPTLSIVDRAFYYLYVNRTSFNGVGGFSTTMLVRRSMSKSVSDYLSMIDSLPQIHNRMSTVICENRDIFDLIDKYDNTNVFMYLDSPYVQSTRKSNQKYDCEMDDATHKKFIDRLLHCKSKILVSGYNCELYDELSKNFKRVDFKSKNSCTDATESLWMNYTPQCECVQLEIF